MNKRIGSFRELFVAFERVFGIKPDRFNIVALWPYEHLRNMSGYELKMLYWTTHDELSYIKDHDHRMMAKTLLQRISNVAEEKGQVFTLASGEGYRKSDPGIPKLPA